MFLLKKKSLLWIIILNIIVISTVGYIKFSDNSYLQTLFVLPWILLLPINSLYISKLLYASKKKTITIISRSIIIITFLFFIDPGFMSIPGRPSGLLKYEIFQNLSNSIPFFFFLLGGIYIIISDILLRFIGNKINTYINKGK